MKLNPYITFPGNAAEELDFYDKSLDVSVVDSHLYNEQPDMCK